jgi:hypothetical protein
MLSVYTRHAEDCKHYRDKLWRRCNCPKWIWGFAQRRVRPHERQNPLLG